MPDFVPDAPVRVRNKNTGHKYTVARVSPDEEVLDGEPALKENGAFLPPEYAEDAAPQAAPLAVDDKGEPVGAGRADGTAVEGKTKTSKSS